MRRADGADTERIWIGVLRLVIGAPGARTLKDRRQVVNAVRDRIRSRFEVSFAEVGGEGPAQQTAVVTTASNDAKTVRSVLDQCAAVLRTHPVAVPLAIDVDVFRWHPSEDAWAARMMAEVGSPDAEDPEEEGVDR